MSENVEWLLNHEGNNSKFVLWAHNFHITKEFKFSNGGSTMGSHLKNIFKDDYYALGFDIYKGSFQAVRENEGLVENEITSKQNSTGYIFSHAKNEIFFVDMETAIKDKINSAFSKQHITLDFYKNCIHLKLSGPNRH